MKSSQIAIFYTTDMFKVQQLQGTLTMAFRRHLILEDFPNMNQHTCWFFLGKYHESKIIICTKVWACSSNTIGPRHFTYYCILLFLSNKTSFWFKPSVDRIIFVIIHLSLTYLLQFTYYLLTFWYSV